MSAVAPHRSDPAEPIFQATFGFMMSAALYAVAKLKVADQLKDGPKTVREIAAAVGANEDALYRTMRALATAGIFLEDGPRHFALTPSADTLRTDVPNSTYDLVMFMADPFHFKVYAEFFHSVQTGEPCVEKVTKMPVFDYFAANPEEAAIFNTAMTRMSAMVIPAVLDTYDFSGIGTLVDVAGGHGMVLTSILQKYPQMKGVLFELPQVAEGARERIRSLGLEGRCQVLTGDFFESVPTGGDAYIMKHIIHDWDDGKATTILRNIHKALEGRANGKVILLDTVLPEGSDPHLGKFIDLEMLAMPGGKERTESEFRTLFEGAGFRLKRVVPNPSPLATIEAERA